MNTKFYFKDMPLDIKFLTAYSFFAWIYIVYYFTTLVIKYYG